jgi:hypothetical protein
VERGRSRFAEPTTPVRLLQTGHSLRGLPNGKP